MQLNPRKREGTEIGDGDAATVGKRSRIDDELQKKEGWKGKGVFFRKIDLLRREVKFLGLFFRKKKKID